MELVHDGDYPTRRILVDDALSVARRLGDDATLLEVTLRRWEPIWMADTIHEMFEEAVELQVLARHVGDPVSRFWANNPIAVSAIQLGQVATMREAHSKMDLLASEIGQPILKWTVAFIRSFEMLLAGDSVQSEALATEAFEIGTETGQPDALAIFAAQLFQIRQHQGRVDEIIDLVIEEARLNPGLSSYRSGAASALVDVGRVDEARVRLEEELQMDFSVPEDFLLLSYLSIWARVTADLGHAEAARVLYDRLLPYPDLVAFTGVSVHDNVSYSLGRLATVLERFDEAESHFEEALRLNQQMDAPYFLAHTQLGYGQMLLARGRNDDAARATAFLALAGDLATQYGYALAERRVGDALDSIAT